MSGDYSNEVTPVPIPNTVVKLICADGTAVFCGRVGRRQAFFYYNHFITKNLKHLQLRRPLGQCGFDEVETHDGNERSEWNVARLFYL